jgi:hypothetical protein
MPIAFRLSVTPDIGPLLARFQNVGKEALDQFDLGMKESMEELRMQLVQASPVGQSQRSGPRIASSWVLQAGYLHYQITNTASQIYYVIKGNDYPHGGGPGDGYIYPTKSKMLVFEIGGQTIFARRVKATRPNDFVTPVRLAWRVREQAIMGTRLRATVHWLAHGA